MRETSFYVAFTVCGEKEHLTIDKKITLCGRDVFSISNAVPEDSSFCCKRCLRKRQIQESLI